VNIGTVYWSNYKTVIFAMNFQVLSYKDNNLEILSSVLGISFYSDTNLKAALPDMSYLQWVSMHYPPQISTKKKTTTKKKQQQKKPLKQTTTKT
jgi:hypothetical protein